MGEKLTDHVAIRPRRGEGLHNWQYLGGKLGQLGGKVEVFGGGGGGELPLP